MTLNLSRDYLKPDRKQKRHPLKPVISYKSLITSELNGSYNRIYLFKVLRRQTIGIINIINVSSFHYQHLF